MMKRSNLGLLSAAMLALCAYCQALTQANAAENCSQSEYAWNQDSVLHQCVVNGIIGSNESCQDDEWKKAETNIDWVLFKDKNALNTYFDGLTEARQCMKDVNDPHGSYHAILHAQKHNFSAQCIIILCYQEYTAWNGYYNYLKKNNKLPTPPTTTQSPPGGLGSRGLYCGMKCADQYGAGTPAAQRCLDTQCGQYPR